MGEREFVDGFGSTKIPRRATTTTTTTTTTSPKTCVAVGGGGRPQLAAVPKPIASLSFHQPIFAIFASGHPHGYVGMIFCGPAGSNFIGQFPANGGILPAGTFEYFLLHFKRSFFESFLLLLTHFHWQLQMCANEQHKHRICALLFCLFSQISIGSPLSENKNRSHLFAGALVRI
jgi:hypothetical protein